MNLFDFAGIDIPATTPATESNDLPLFASAYVREHNEKMSKAEAVPAPVVPDPCHWCGEQPEVIPSKQGTPVIKCVNPDCSHRPVMINELYTGDKDRKYNWAIREWNESTNTETWVAVAEVKNTGKETTRVYVRWGNATVSHFREFGDEMAAGEAATRLKGVLATALPLPTYAEVYAYLLNHYKSERFEDRNGDWCPDYSYRVAASHWRDLAYYGHDFVSIHEDKAGSGIKYTGADVIAEVRNAQPAPLPVAVVGTPAANTQLVQYVLENRNCVMGNKGIRITLQAPFRTRKFPATVEGIAVAVQEITASGWVSTRQYAEGFEQAADKVVTALLAHPFNWQIDNCYIQVSAGKRFVGPDAWLDQRNDGDNFCRYAKEAGLL